MPDQDAFEIREATSSDADTIAGFVIAMAAATEDIELDAGSVREAVATALPDPDRARYWLATVGGRVVGQLMITREWSDWNNAWYWWIQSVYVEPDWRRRGVFRALCEHVAALARERGAVCALRLFVLRDNEGARRTYEELGMTEQPFAVYEQRLREE